MSEPISIESTTKRENRVSFLEHRNKIIGKIKKTFSFLTTRKIFAYVLLLITY